MNGIIQLPMARATRRIAGASMCLVLCMWSAPQASSAEDAAIQQLAETSKAFAQVAKKATPAVVFITAERTVEVRQAPGQFFFNAPSDLFNDEFFNRFFPHRMPHQAPPQQAPQPRRQQLGQGSGFIISADGYILTNHHVVGEADKITVKLGDGREFVAKKVGTDPKSDVAVIKIEATELPVLPLGDSDALEVGEWVIAIGNPFGLAETVTVGVVSAKGRSRVGIADYEDFIQTDAAINPGNSGGPLLNLHGEAIGINTAIFSRSGGYMGIGFAIPVNMARNIKDQLVKTGKVTRGYLGILMQELTAELAESLSAKTNHGILVAEVVADPPAGKVGFKQGDIITKLNGSPVQDLGQFRNTVGMMVPGSKARVAVLRDGKEQVLVVEIGTWSESAVATTGGEALSEDLAAKLGFQVQDLSGELAERFGYAVGEGVVISQVEPGSPAASAGLRPGALITSVNRQAVKTVQEFSQALSRSREKRSALLLVKQQNHTQFVVLKWE